ncbi:MAG: bifunctional 3-deoxy-7-phosphoheptulonate synthase/chorismate mutase type II [Bacteroidales bacterium]|nr:bifunctional 3-deoxy-7-phosphoheptulonate synthase/chorismate mutase type II [Bacteroidales bacterium]MBD5246458.1 bifunctional 3-deoxy-7-phosphoheptulonate synthase/chorismate mutase type II [Barnesiella sp.]
MNNLQPIAFDGIEIDKPIIIAGPCSAETEEQVLSTARELASYGIKIYRAGIWKPRTKPGGFEGVGEVGLEWLKKVKEETGMKVSTEVANRAHVEAALAAGVDMLWIGARTSANPFAMQEIADAIGEISPDTPVLVKNPVNPDLELWIGALERLHNAGVTHLGAIHRGFTAYGKHLYRNMPQWHIPAELRRRIPNLPIIIDPSHIGGKRELVAPLAQQAFDMGFDGLIVESHCNPDCAWSDKTQQVSPDVLNFILNTISLRNDKCTTENITLLRQEIDRLDNDLLEVLNKRMRVCREIGQYKKEHNMQVLQTGRFDSIIQSRVKLANEMGMSTEFMRTVLMAIHEESVRQQLEIFNKR